MRVVNVSGISLQFDSLSTEGAEAQAATVLRLVNDVLANSGLNSEPQFIIEKGFTAEFASSEDEVGDGL